MAVSNEDLNAFFAASWPDHPWSDFSPILSRSLAYICAYAGDALVGFVNLAWDGSVHAFLLDTTVHPRWRRRGIGRQLVVRACAAARERGMHWLLTAIRCHVVAGPFSSYNRGRAAGQSR